MPFLDLYGALARRRRRWYDARPERRRRLDNPVVSVGALSVGGSGKTPVAAEVARVVLSLGERPAVLSRGYGREERPRGVVVVSDRGRLCSDITVAGDEPFMLAQRLSDASVVVAEDRYLAGKLAETHLGATVHVLDDGFQHLTLNRDVDLLVIAPDELRGARTLPFGRLREPVDTATNADALVVDAADAPAAWEVGRRLHVTQIFRLTRELGPPRRAETSAVAPLAPGVRVLAVAGIARPSLFVDGLTSAGYDVVDLMSFRDHHVYSSRDLAAIGERLTRTSASYAVTTEKDIVKLRRLAPLNIDLLWVPLQVSIDPPEQFRNWLSDRLSAARGRG